MPTVTSSQMALFLKPVFVNLAGPKQIASAGLALYLFLFKDDATGMVWLYPVRRKIDVSVVAVRTNFLAGVGAAAKCFRTDNGAEFVNTMSTRVYSDKTIGIEHTGVDGRKNNGVVDRGLGLIHEGGMAARFEARRLLPGKLPDLDRLWV